MNKEIWKDIENYEGLYQVSNLGRVRSLDKKVYHNASINKLQNKKGKILKCVNNGKYYVLTLSKDGIHKQYRIHKLVAQAFIPNPNNLPQINHKDENKFNNCVDNLEWCTAKYNCNYGSRNNRIVKKKSKKIGQYDLNENIIRIWTNSVEASKKLNIAKQTINRCCRNQYGSKTAGGYKWKYI